MLKYISDRTVLPHVGALQGRTAALCPLTTNCCDTTELGGQGHYSHPCRPTPQCAGTALLSIHLLISLPVYILPLPLN